MARTFTEEALVLKAYDVGEADRFCVLFTKDRGKIAARARAVRKMTSRYGGSVLPLQRITVVCSESSAGCIISGATCISSHDACRKNLPAYSAALEGIDILLSILPDHEAVPEMYDLACEYLAACSTAFSPLVVQSFKLRLLKMLGALPSVTHSVISHQALETKMYFSPRYAGFCQLQEDSSARPISTVLAGFLQVYDRYPLVTLQLEKAAQAELGELLTDLTRDHSAMTSAASKLAPLAAPGLMPT